MVVSTAHRMNGLSSKARDDTYSLRVFRWHDARRGSGRLSHMHTRWISPGSLGGVKIIVAGTALLLLLAQAKEQVQVRVHGERPFPRLEAGDAELVRKHRGTVSHKQRSP